MAAAYLCPHCNARNRFDPKASPDGVVRCGACAQPFLLPDHHAHPGKSSRFDTARIVAPGPELGEETAIVDTRADTQATIAFDVSSAERREGSGARTQPTGVPAAPAGYDSGTQPVDVPTGPPALPAEAGGVSILGYVLVAAVFVAGFGLAKLLADEPPDVRAAMERAASTWAEATADRVAAHMTAGRPDLAAAGLDGADLLVVRPDGTRAFVDTDGTSLRRNVRSACAKTAPGSVRAWFAGDPRIRVLGEKPCAARDRLLEGNPVKVAGVVEHLGRQPSWLDSSADPATLYVSAPIARTPACAACHSGSADPLGFVLVRTELP